MAPAAAGGVLGGGGRRLRRIACVLSCPYFFVNLAVLATYVWVRSSRADAAVAMKPFTWSNLMGSMKGSSNFSEWETQMATAIALSSTMRAAKSSVSLEGAAFAMLSAAQVFVLVMGSIADVLIGLHYAVAFLAAFLLLEQPQCGDDDVVQTLTTKILASVVMADGASNDECYVLYVHVPWSLSCQHAYGAYLEMARRYSSPKVHFCRIDVGDFPAAARKLRLDLASGNVPLPTLMLMEGGREVSRMPQETGDDDSLLSAIIAPSLKFSRVAAAFDLDARLATSMAVGGGGSGDKSRKE
uniref:Thioredoxin domain-containing protein n=1 Tax=Chlamydomonas euryale TaxID=1486919 RepID=A0A7R9V6X0_9CHLO|mmetsp:Transcript_22514/g.67036  ORF Transcript_22514/g.67036 Transcript_22514/m.67036 type:complete len:299 (+) Transcript_22514:263-1159(+)